ncbi:MAG: DUF362 domain-containing protein [Desulfobulbaceae bacterium]|nr:MAG: DUF362 domain-containing protein [Desulfobulbaceae bacterium]
MTPHKNHTKKTIVYFKKYSGITADIISNSAKELLEKLILEESVTLAETVPIKTHFGEEQNTSFLPPALYDGIIDYLQEHGVAASFIETNVLYRSPRTRKESHLQLARKNGFTRLPILIAEDGGEKDTYEVQIDKKFFQSVKLARSFKQFQQVIVLSHFKGHKFAGFGGALKQLAMGFASRSGKMAQHSKMIPHVLPEKCTLCAECALSCDHDAISFGEHMIISEEKCVGCANCVATCPEEAVKNDWKGVNFREKIAEYAYGAQLNKKLMYLSFLVNITEECDCMRKEMTPFTDNIGILASMNPVALDAASLDLVQQATGKPWFDIGREALDHAEKIGFATQNYTLKEL